MLDAEPVKWRSTSAAALRDRLAVNAEARDTVLDCESTKNDKTVLRQPEIYNKLVPSFFQVRREMGSQDAVVA